MHDTTSVQRTPAGALAILMSITAPACKNADFHTAYRKISEMENQYEANWL
jgi:hypothetical protein